MERDTAQNGIATLIRSRPDIMSLLPGGVWTRRIKPNTNQDGLAPTPGSTPEAFDHAGRILRCVSVLNGTASVDPLGPVGAYYGFPEVYFRCLPHETEKRLLNQAMDRVTRLIEGAVIPGLSGEGLILRAAARIDPDDDPELPPAVVGMIRVQVDSVWS